MSMSYDAARRQVVLFGGIGGGADTWTWDGTGWTRRHPAHSPAGGSFAGMANDAARSQVVLFGGIDDSGNVDDTWTWDGTDWTKQTPANSPSTRQDMGMDYDAARSQVVLFGGVGDGDVLGDTWIWDGKDWTQQSPADSPVSREGLGLAYDAARSQVVLFGGVGDSGNLGDTWTWDGTDWTQRPAGAIALDVYSGPPGAVVTVQGWGFLAGERVRILFVDGVSGPTLLRKVRADSSGAFTKQITIPVGATLGRQHLKAKGVKSGQTPRRTFTVT